MDVLDVGDDGPDRDVRGRGDPVARLARWLQPTPAEVLGLVVLLLGAVSASGLWWWQAGQRPDPGPAAQVGAAVDGDGEVVGAAPGGDATGDGDDGAQAPPSGGDQAPDATRSGDDGAEREDAQPTRLTVHVSGAVASPGVVSLDGDGRVGDAVEAAGGLLDEADPERINLARELADGDHVHVPREGEPPPQLVDPVPGELGTSGAGGGEDGEPIALNTADEQRLQQLPGIGPALAAAIVEHREEHGPFAVPGDLRDVAGIGEVTFQRLAPLVTVR